MLGLFRFDKNFKAVVLLLSFALCLKTSHATDYKQRSATHLYNKMCYLYKAH